MRKRGLRFMNMKKVINKEVDKEPTLNVAIPQIYFEHYPDCEIKNTEPLDLIILGNNIKDAQ